MSQRAVAARLGLSRTYVQFLEWRALNKIRAALGLPERECPRWARDFQSSTREERHRAGRRSRCRKYRAASSGHAAPEPAR